MRQARFVVAPVGMHGPVAAAPGLRTPSPASSRHGPRMSPDAVVALVLGMPRSAEQAGCRGPHFGRVRERTQGCSWIAGAREAAARQSRSRAGGSLCLGSCPGGRRGSRAVRVPGAPGVPGVPGVPEQCELSVRVRWVATSPGCATSLGPVPDAARRRSCAAAGRQGNQGCGSARQRGSGAVSDRESRAMGVPED